MLPGQTVVASDKLEELYGTHELAGKTSQAIILLYPAALDSSDTNLT